MKSTQKTHLIIKIFASDRHRFTFTLVIELQIILEFANDTRMTT